jgi:hypothetical protein
MNPGEKRNRTGAGRKRAAFIAALSLVLTLAMFIGGTYALSRLPDRLNEFVGVSETDAPPTPTPTSTPTPSAKPPVTSPPTPPPGGSGSPKTGDDANTSLFYLLIAACAILLRILTRRSRRR